MSGSNTKAWRKREFKPDVPWPLLEKLPADSPERWMYEQQSIQRQQNEAILERLEVGEERFDEADQAREDMRKDLRAVASRVEVFERFKDRVTAKWTVLAFIACGVIAPIVLAFLGAMFIRWFERVWK